MFAVPLIDLKFLIEPAASGAGLQVGGTARLHSIKVAAGLTEPI
jgi:hypothetical protein